MAAAMDQVATTKGGGSYVEFIRSRSDKREYRRVVLPNAMEVLLISDADADKAAASMEVAVGSFSNPDGLEGLAHFLEHMLFYASEKYPVEGDYSKYITEHGGWCNAYTESEITNYHFTVNVDDFEQALDRFAQFFVCPLMSSDAVLREIKAVDSEHKKNLLSDGCRIAQLRGHFSLEDHPYHKFSTGSWETLEIKPKEKGIDIRAELLKFYENHYSANLMRLAVYSKESLDHLHGMVERMFSAVKNSNRLYFRCPGSPCMEDHLQILVKAIPITDGDYLRIEWPVTAITKFYKESPGSYFSHLIGHEGEGSIYYVLKQLGWAVSLVAGISSDSLEYSFFKVGIRLTAAGHDHMEEIIGLVFKYILLLQEDGILEWIFDELASKYETFFHYQDNVPPIDYILDIGANMRIFPPEEWLVGYSMPSKYDPDILKVTLNELSPSRVRIFWQSKKFEGLTNSVEPWYGTSYSVENINPSMIKQWIEKAPAEKLHLPKPNIFIPTDFSLKEMPEKVKYPLLLRKSPFSKLWHKPDTEFFVPKTYIVMDFNCPLANHSPEALICTKMFVELLVDNLNDYAYDATIAGLSYSIYHTCSGFMVYVAGYNHKIRLLVDAIMNQIENFVVKPNRFAVFKETLIDDYKNMKFSQPCSQASYYVSLILEDRIWPWTENLEALSELEADRLGKFLPYLLSKAFVECYISGNIEPSEAKSIVEDVEGILFKSTFKKLSPSQYLTTRIVMLESDVKCCYQVECLNEKDENSALVQYIQVHEDDTHSNVKLELFALIACQPAFNQLRTVEQLGYIASLSSRSDCKIKGLEFVVQSSLKDAAYLDTRVDTFMKMYEAKLYELSDEDFQRNVKALIDLKLEKFKNLWEEGSFFWGEIGSGALKFDRIESEVASLRELKKEEFIEFFDQHIKVGAPQRKTLSVQVFCKNHSAEYQQAVTEALPPKTHRIDDIFGFRRSRPLYRSFKGGPGHITA